MGEIIPMTQPLHIWYIYIYLLYYCVTDINKEIIDLYSFLAHVNWKGIVYKLRTLMLNAGWDGFRKLVVALFEMKEGEGSVDAGVCDSCFVRVRGGWVSVIWSTLSQIVCAVLLTQQQLLSVHSCLWSQFLMSNLFSIQFAFCCFFYWGCTGGM
jgi:hypothetical protein